MTALRGPEHVGWDRHVYMLADVFDAIRGLTYLFEMANTKDPKKVKPLPPYPRPGVKDADKADKPTNPLLARLRGEAVPAHLGPGSKVPPPPAR